MPYADPERQREYMRTWRKTHPEQLKGYQRASVLQSAVTKRRFPSASSVKHHSLTKEELIHIVTCMVEGNMNSEVAF